jgi:predicted transcriptional regulator
MSIIQPQPRIERQATTIKLEAPLIRALKLYAEYIHSSQEWVVNEALRLTFTRDAGFQQWLRTHHTEAADGLSSQGVTRRRPGSRRRTDDKPI